MAEYAFGLRALPQALDLPGETANERAREAGRHVADRVGQGIDVAVFPDPIFIRTTLPADSPPIISDGGPDFGFQPAGTLFYPPAAPAPGTAYYVEPTPLSAPGRPMTPDEVAAERERLETMLHEARTGFTLDGAGSTHYSGLSDARRAEVAAEVVAELEGLERSQLQASPAARRLAEELGVELANVTGTGKDGRIVLADIEASAPEPQPTPAADDEPDDEIPTAPLPSLESRNAAAERARQRMREERGLD